MCPNVSSFTPSTCVGQRNLLKMRLHSEFLTTGEMKKLLVRGDRHFGSSQQERPSRHQEPQLGEAMACTCQGENRWMQWLLALGKLGVQRGQCQTSAELRHICEIRQSGFKSCSCCFGLFHLANITAHPSALCPHEWIWW